MCSAMPAIALRILTRCHTGRILNVVTQHNPSAVAEKSGEFHGSSLYSVLDNAARFTLDTADNKSIGIPSRVEVEPEENGRWVVRFFYPSEPAVELCLHCGGDLKTRTRSSRDLRVHANCYRLAVEWFRGRQEEIDAYFKRQSDDE